MRRKTSSFNKGPHVVRSILLIFASISLFSIFFTYVGLAVQSSVRAYVAGESLWSKAQRDATYNLNLYASTRKSHFYEEFKKDLLVPNGLMIARLELLKDEFSHEIAEAGLLQGGTTADDIYGVIKLFRCCHDYKYFKTALQNWEVGDQYMRKLEDLGKRIDDEVKKRSPDNILLSTYIDQIDAISREVRPYANAFTDALGNAAREVTRLLFLITCVVIGCLISAGVYLSLRIAKEARDTEEQYQLLFESAGDAIMVLDRSTNRIIEANDKAVALTGRPSHDLFESDFRSVFLLSTDLSLLSGTDLRLNLINGRGDHIPVEINGNYTEWFGKPAYLAIVRDISERIQSENTLRIAANAMANMAEGVVITTTNGTIISVNAAFTAITGFLSSAVLNKPITESLLKDERRLHTRKVLRKVQDNGSWRGEVKGRRHNGEHFMMDLSISAVHSEKGEIDNFVIVLSDITLSKGYEKQLLHIANHDTLTQLPNRVAFHEECKKLIDKANKKIDSLALLFIDLDGFKLINDTYGHTAGDHVLRVVAERLLACIKSNDFIARLGGDEFVILLQGEIDRHLVSAICRRILGHLGKSIIYLGHDLTVLASIGIAVSPKDGMTVESLLIKADTAMYEAKHKGRNNYQFYEPQMTVDATSRMQLLSALRDAVSRNEFELYYQPCIRLADNRTVGLEALIRWNHPELGLVPPDRFIALAEETGLIGTITDWVIERACSQVKAWACMEIPTVPVAVNISPLNFRDLDLPQKIGDILKRTECPSSMLCLEITENAMMNRQKSIDMLKDLNALGILMAIDDFGMGYSSLSYLKDFPVQYLKIDKSFMVTSKTDENNAAIIRTIVALASSLGLKVIAEGVETLEQAAFLVHTGCDEAQGYLYSKPVKADAMQQWLLQQDLRDSSYV